MKIFDLVLNNKREKQFKAQAAGDVLKIHIDDVIIAPDYGFGVSARDVRTALEGWNGSAIEIYINSPGGDVFEARAMVAELARSKAKKTVYIDGLAASCASWVALVGDEVIIAQGAMMMIHRSWSLAYGNEGDLRATAEVLSKIDDTILADYVQASARNGANVGLNEFRAKLNAETWLSAEESVALGLATKVAGQKGESVANYDLSAYQNAPKVAQNEGKNDDQAAQLSADIAAQLAKNERQLSIIARMNHS